jgi:hypothetical protein
MYYISTLYNKPVIWFDYCRKLITKKLSYDHGAKF